MSLNINNNMTIGTVDYVSTAPWNDPTNPWPAYAQVSLSASDIVPVTLPLKQFDPAAAGGGSYPFVTYQNGSMYPALIKLTTTTWGVLSGDVNYALTTTSRDIPLKTAGVTGGWTRIIEGNAASLYIAADTSVITPWEYRRRRLLEIC